jgi:iron complex outermembrane receptor protein
MKSLQTLTILLLYSVTTYSQTIVTGKIIDQETHEPIPGVTVASGQQGTSTLADGSFELVTTDAPDSLELRCVGYCTRKIGVGPGNVVMATLAPATTTMHEVVVTASRDMQTRGEVAMAIDKVSAADLNDAKPTLLAEMMNKVPGVATLNYNNEQHGMSIRQPMGTSPYFLYLEDGIPLRPMGVFNHNAMIEMNLLAISGIEVVKGPASSFYGPEAVGGAINFITHRPTAMPTARVGLQFDNFGYRRVQYSAGAMPLKKLGFFVGGFYGAQRDGWMTYSDYDKNALNARVDYFLAANTKLTLAGAWNDYYSQTPGSVDSIAFYSRRYVSTSDFTYRKVRALRVRLSADHYWNDRHHTTLHLFYRDNSIGQNPSYAIRWGRGETTATGEINDNSFQSRGFIVQHVSEIVPSRLKLVGGVSLDDSPDTYQSYRVDLAAQLRPDGQSVEKYTIVEERPDIRIADYDAALVNTAVYLQAEVRPAADVVVTLGGRYDNMTFEYDNHLDLSAGVKTYEKFTPKAGVVYTIGDDAGVYVNYSMGFAPPGLTSIFRKKPDSEGAEFYYDLEPATFVNYEAGGWMSLFANKLDVDVSVYRMTGRNELLNIRRPDNSTDYQSAGRTTHEGVEYGVTYRPDTQWMLRLGGTNAIHRFDDFALSTRPTDPVQNVNGKRMPAAPSWIANVELLYKPVWLKGLRLGMEWQRMSPWYENQINTFRYEDKGFLGMKGVSVLTLRTGYAWKGAEVFLNVMNVTDELYAFYSSRGNREGDRATFTPAPPRTFVFGVQYNFLRKFGDEN